MAKMKKKDKKPIAYITKSKCIWMKDPSDNNRFIPNPNAEGSYHESYCIELEYEPIYEILTNVK